MTSQNVEESCTKKHQPCASSNTAHGECSKVPISTATSSPTHHVFMIGIAGGSASGKTSVSSMVIGGINQANVVLISMDSFYKVLNPSERARAQKQEYDFDSPASFDSQLLVDTLRRMRKGLDVEIPEYDFCTHSRTANSTFVPGAASRSCNSLVVVFEGIMALHFEEVVSMMDLKVFVDTDDDVRLARRLIRDIAERGRCTDSVLDMYFRFAKPGYDNFIFPSCRNADLIIPRGADNLVAIDILINHVKECLDK